DSFHDLLAGQDLAPFGPQFGNGLAAACSLHDEVRDERDAFRVVELDASRQATPGDHRRQRHDQLVSFPGCEIHEDDHIFGTRKGLEPGSRLNCWRKLSRACLNSEASFAAKRMTMRPLIQVAAQWHCSDRATSRRNASRMSRSGPKKISVATALQFERRALRFKCGNVSSLARKQSAQISWPSLLTRQRSVICPPVICSPCAARPRTSHSRASSCAPDESSISVSRLRRARLKLMVSCGSHASLAPSQALSLVTMRAGSSSAR